MEVFSSIGKYFVRKWLWLTNLGGGENENLCWNDIMFSLGQIEDNKYFSVADSCAQSRVLFGVRTEGGWEGGSGLGIIHTAVDRTGNQI